MSVMFIYRLVPIIVTDLVPEKSDLQLRGISQKIDSRQVEQGFSSFFAKFLAYIFDEFSNPAPD